jgi:N-acetylglucosaminyldiphosphoundecaprenol N-acetyl-beta-D-mannosaminyltransferase
MAEKPQLSFCGVHVTETNGFPPIESTGLCLAYITLNAEIALHARNDPRFMEIVNAPSSRVSVDGQWVLWALRRKYPEKEIEKQSGSDLIFSLAAHCAVNGKRLALLGGSRESNAGAVSRLRESHPGLQVEGFSPSHFAAEDVTDEATRTPIREWLQRARPRYLVLGFGVPKEQLWVHEERAWLSGEGVAVAFCFGGSIDFASGSVRRAPTTWQRLGLEGIYRVVQQPKRLWRFLRVLRLLPHLLTTRY